MVLKDPVCGRRIRRDRAHARVEYNRVTYYLCCPRCQAEFEASPGQYARPEAGEPRERVSAREGATHRQPS